LLVVTVGATLGSAATNQVTQNFDSDPADWVGTSNLAGFDNFGFSNSNNVGLGAGEAGGGIARDSSLSTYLTSVGSLDPSTDTITLSGSAIFKAPHPDFFMLGYYNPVSGEFAGDGRPRNFMGLYSDDRALFLMMNSDGSFGFTNLNVRPDLDTVWDFNLTYDPNGNGGGGTMTGTVAGVPVNQNLNAGAKDAFLNFTSFGLVSRVTADADRATHTFVDNLSYTVAIVPEPSGILLTLIAIACGSRGVRRSRMI
jgi:hypothetical protein